jgi:5-methylcytosine-specific restriction endonuclease McrA
MSETSVDHILPRRLGGLTTWENVCLACVKCNSRKGGKTLEECGMKLLKQPYKPKFNQLSFEIKIESWKHFISEIYWNVELQNDNK